MKFEQMEKISIIIPVYKVEKYLDRCIGSVVNQTYKNLEIILVENGSPDNCPAMCDEWAKKDNRIIVIHQNNNGVSAARNAGLKIATGEYIGFVDSDDYIEPNMYKRLYGLIKEFGADIAQCSFLRIFSNGERIPYENIAPEGIISDQYLFFKLLFQRIISFTIWNKLFSKKIITNVYFPNNIGSCEDMFFVYQSLKNTKKIAMTNDIYYNYYLGRANSATKLDFNLKGTVTVFDCVKKDLHKFYPELIKIVDLLMVKRITHFYNLSRKAIKEKTHDISISYHMMLWSKRTFKQRLKYLFFQSDCPKILLIRCFCLVFFPKISDLFRPIFSSFLRIGRGK